MENLSNCKSIYNQPLSFNEHFTVQPHFGTCYQKEILYRVSEKELFGTTLQSKAVNVLNMHNFSFARR